MATPAHPATQPRHHVDPADARHQGVRIWRWGTVALALVCLLCLGAQPDVDGVRQLIRATARTSLLFFLMAYTAQAVSLTWPGARSAWLRRHRRQWGWLLATSHGFHAAGIVALDWMAPTLFEQLSPIGQRIGPGVAYVVLAAMVATSFDRSAAWLGPRWWARLHTWGSHYLCLSFLVANGKRVAQQPVYALPVLLLILAVLWRLWAARQRRTPGVSASAQG